jgi:hypothetical protein
VALADPVHPACPAILSGVALAKTEALSQVEGLMALSEAEGLVFHIMPARLDFETHPVNPVILSICVQ